MRAPVGFWWTHGAISVGFPGTLMWGLEATGTRQGVPDPTPEGQSGALGCPQGPVEGTPEW